MLSEIQVAVDVGSTRHRVAIGAPDGKLLAEFDIPHTPAGFGEFFRRIERLSQQRPVAVAMEGYNGYARPLDRMILGHGFRLYSVNNLKLARYKEIFPAPAKTDAIDGRKILELFRLRDHVPLARDVLQEATPAPPAHEKLKRLTRRRRQLVNEKVRLLNRLQADLQAVCPGLLQITGQADNLWFLRFLICRGEITQLAHLRNTTLLGLAGVGKTYAAQIRAWQQTAQFSDEVAWVGPMIVAAGCWRCWRKSTCWTGRSRPLPRHRRSPRPWAAFPASAQPARRNWPERSARWTASPARPASRSTWA